MLKNIFCICFLIIGFITSSIAQASGGNKWSQKWKQYNSEAIKVIFPLGFEEQATGVFSLLNYLNQNHRESIGLKTDKVSLVLNNLTNISNGYVGLAPFRSEFFTTPTQNSFTLGSLPWLDLLTIHEYRHVLQFSNAKYGLSKTLSILFGQSAFAGSINLALPDWYFEGDAVMAETAMSNQGRGRIPYFLRAYKAYEAEGRRFSYQKVRNGSYKNFIPDHYRLGYMMTKYGADQYGQTFWAEVLADAAAYKGLIYPFSNAIKSRSGHTTASLYQATFDDYKTTWSIGNVNVTEGENLISSSDKIYANYSFPRYDSKGRLYYIKGSLNTINEIWSSDGTASKKLLTLGGTNDTYIDINGGKISWAELRYHPARGNINYSVAMSYDIATGQKHQVSFQTRYSSPTAHPDGKVMAVVDIDHLGDTQIKIISTRDGLVIDSLANSPNYFITYPKWNKAATHLYFAARDLKGRMAICQQSRTSGTIKSLSPWSYKPIGVPHVTETHIYYSKSDADAEHIYRVSIHGGMEEMVVESKFGAYQPYVLDNSIAYSSYTSDGLRLMKSTIKPKPTLSSTEYPNDKTYEAYGGNVLSSRPKASSSPKSYGRLNNAINIHSWGLTADDQTASVLLQSNNVLNSVSLSGGLQYVFDDNRAIWTAGASFGFIYPNLTTRYTLEAREITLTNDDDQEVNVGFNDHNISVGLEAPLNLSSGAYSRLLVPHYSIERRLFKGSQIEDINFTSQRLGVIFQNRRFKAPQEVLAVNSQFINLNYQGTIDNREGNQFDLESEFTFPGIVKSHAIRVELDYNSKDNPGLYSDRFEPARGYPDILAEKGFRLGLNYHLPVLYPDFGIAGIAYLRRVQANIFYDYSSLSADENTLDLSSTGVEFLFDTNLLNTLPVTFGVRYAHTIDIQDNVIEFFIPFYRF